MADATAGHIKELGAALERLVENPPCTREELSAWEDRAWHIKSELIYARELFGVPHFLMDYLDSAQTRLNDSSYAEYQRPAVNALIEFLKKGVIPSDADLP